MGADVTVGAAGPEGFTVGVAGPAGAVAGAPGVMDEGVIGAVFVVGAVVCAGAEVGVGPEEFWLVGIIGPVGA